MPRTDSAALDILAPVDKVYAALVGPEALIEWLPPGEMTGRIERFDPRPGGSYRMELKHPDHSVSQGKTTSDTDVIEGRFIELIPNERVVWAVDFVSDDPGYDSTMIMKWDVAAIDGGTRVRITADNVPDVVTLEDHAEGMSSSLAKLAEYLNK
jgi:uncharacterized protein YndB with AHSA1/START domain